MSSSSYSQGLQSCLEPSRMVEPLVLRLKLAPPKSNSPAGSSSPPPKPRFITNQEEESNPKGNTIDMGGWSFLQCLSSQSQSLSHPPYNPPSMKRSSSFLCEKSLEMCTESLGSETGSGDGEKGGGGGKEEVAALRSLENVGYNSTNYEKNDQEINIGSRLVGNRRRYKRIDTFPPPLTSISGSSGVQVKPHREGGRLVLKAVSVSLSQGYFHAERNNGRLTLHLVKDCSISHCEHKEEEVEGEEEEEEEEEMGYNLEEELEGNSGKGGEEMGMVGKLASRPVSRCKESESGSKGLLERGKPFLVAT